MNRFLWLHPGSLGSIRPRVQSLPILALALALVAGQLAVKAGEVSSLTIAGGDAVWTISLNSGTDTGLPDGECDNSPGFGVEEGVLINGGQEDAVDYGAMIWVNDELFVAPGPPSVQGQSVSAGPALMSGLNVSVEYAAVPPVPGGSQNVLRTLGTFQNPSASPISATILLTTNLGSDDSTVTIGSSTGDTDFTTQDRWLITDDLISGGGGGGGGEGGAGIGILAVDDGDPANTHVLFGPGNPAETPTAVSQSTFDCSGTEGPQVTFNLTIPAGATQRLMFFNTLEETSAVAVQNADTFDVAPDLGSNLLMGLTETQLSEIVNWEFPESDELSPLLLLGQGTLQVNRFRNSFIVVARRQRRRALSGNVQYTNFANHTTFRSTSLTHAVALGSNGVRLQGWGRVGTGPMVPFTADIVDNPGSADTVGLVVAGGPNLPPTTIRTGFIRLQRP